MLREALVNLTGLVAAIEEKAGEEAKGSGEKCQVFRMNAS